VGGRPGPNYLDQQRKTWCARHDSNVRPSGSKPGQPDAENNNDDATLARIYRESHRKPHPVSSRAVPTQPTSSRTPTAH
jgi:hypothetical protein